MMQKCQMLDILREKVAGCVKCQELAETRTQTIFGEGSPDADLLFLGEAGGKDEDEQGKPFVGRAGQLLTNIITAMNLTREEVYICNILKCRPPNNRIPTLEEAKNCQPFLEFQIKIVNPKIIICLGATAVRHLLKIDAPISRIRGSWHSYRDIPTMPTFHPSFLMRNGNSENGKHYKKLVWEDMQEVLKKLTKLKSGLQ